MMQRLMMLVFSFCICYSVNAKTFLVGNSDELVAANSAARPGDTVILKNGVWTNIVMKLNCFGTKEQPIVFKAQTAGKVVISGISQLRLAGNYIVVEGLLFENGYSPSNSVIDFRFSSKELANNCRVTNCVISDFNKPKRMSDDQWVSFSGKNNRLDHCSFLNKKNMGVLLAVLLDDERSRENGHSIDHNYFGVRLPLGSNGGEIIRVGLSQHAQFNSGTEIRNNYFEKCDGEAEIISIKSGNNIISNNVFKECQGSVVLRHGDHNTVTNNIFLGNGKEATGGVRIINKGQWVINNLFYKCRGESFRAPLTIMNGVPNSPANRYVQVTDAVVMNNSFIDCSPMSLGEGSDKERTLSPDHVLFAKNVFYNSSDSVIYKEWDDLSGIQFSENKVSKSIIQQLPTGFEKASFQTRKMDGFIIPLPRKSNNRVGLDSLRLLNDKRLPVIHEEAGFSFNPSIKHLLTNRDRIYGATWYYGQSKKQITKTVQCRTAEEIYHQISKNQDVIIRLTGDNYDYIKPVLIGNNIRFTSDKKRTISFKSKTGLGSLFLIQKNGKLMLDNLTISAAGLNVLSFISTDTSGSSDHFNLSINNVSLSGLKKCSFVLYVHKSTFADSITVKNSTFSDMNNGFAMAEEKDDKGYYNVEKVIISNNDFINGNGILLNLYRGGADESTLGPDMIFSGNKIRSYNTTDSAAIIELTGVQKSKLIGNTISQSNYGKKLMYYKDVGRSMHRFEGNKIKTSGSMGANEYVVQNNNVVE